MSVAAHHVLVHLERDPMATLKPFQPGPDGALGYWKAFDTARRTLTVALRDDQPKKHSWREVRLVAHELLHLQAARERNADHDPWWKFTVACGHPLRLFWGDAKWLRSYAIALLRDGRAVVPATSPAWAGGPE